MHALCLIKQGKQPSSGEKVSQGEQVFDIYKLVVQLVRSLDDSTSQWHRQYG